MPSNIHVGGAYFSLSAVTAGYQGAMGQAAAANARFRTSMAATAAAATRAEGAFSRVGQSLRSSLIATAGYALGVGAVSAAVRGTGGAFLDFDKALIAVEKTTGLTAETLEYTLEQINKIGTEPGRAGRALGILRDDLFKITIVAGQMGLRSVQDIEAVARAAAELQVSSDLVGTEAVRSLSTYLKATDQIGDVVGNIDRIASVVTHLGNNIESTESKILSFATVLAANARAVGGLSDEMTFGLTAALVVVRARTETAGTVIQRLLDAFNDLADRDPRLLRDMIQAMGYTADQALNLEERFNSANRSMLENDEILDLLLGHLSTLQKSRGEFDQGPTRQGFLDQFFPENNVRVNYITGLLDNYRELTRYRALAADGLERENAHTIEAGKSAEAYSARLRVVNNRLQEIGTTFGEWPVRGLVVAVENLGLLTAAAGGLIALWGGRASNRAFRRRRAALAEQGKTVDALTESQKRHTEQVRQNQTVLARTQNRIDNYNRSKRAEVRTTRALTRAQKELNRTEHERRNINRSRQALIARYGSAANVPGGERTDTHPLYATAKENRDRAKEARNVAREQRSAILLARDRDAIKNSKDLRNAYIAQKRQTDSLARSQEKLDTVNAQLNKQMSAGSRIGRALGATVNFLGGPLGIAIIGMYAAGAAMTYMSQRGDQLNKRLRELERRNRAVAESLSQEGLTEAGKEIAEGQDLVGVATRRLVEAQENLASVEAKARTGGRVGLVDPTTFAQLRVQRAERALQRAIDANRGTIENLTGNADEQFKTSLEIAAEYWGGVFDYASGARIEVEKYVDAVHEQSRAEITAAQIQRATAGLALGRREEETLVLQRQADLAAKIREEDRRRNVLHDEYIAAGFKRQEIERRLQERRPDGTTFLTPGGEAYDRARQDLRDATELAKQKNLERVAAEKLVNELRKEVILNDDLLRQAREQNYAAAALAANTRTFDLPVEFRARVEAERTLIEFLNERYDAAQDLRTEELKYAASTRREEAAIAASRAIRLDYSNSIRDIGNELTVVIRLLGNAQRELDALEVSRLEAIDSGGFVPEETLRLLPQTIGEVDTLKRRREELITQREVLRGMADDHYAAAEAAERHAAALERLSSPLSLLAKEAARLGDNLEEVVASGLNRLGDEITQFAVSGAYDFKAFATAVVQDLIRILVQAQIVLPLVNAIKAQFPGATSTQLTAEQFFAGHAHSGGIAGHLNQRAVRGAIRGDEVFAVLQKGEEVITAHDPRHRRNIQIQDPGYLKAWAARLPRFHSGGVVGGGAAAIGAPVQINLINRSGRRMAAQDGGSRRTPRGMVRDIILEDARDNGPITRGLRSTL